MNTCSSLFLFFTLTSFIGGSLLFLSGFFMTSSKISDMSDIYQHDEQPLPEFSNFKNELQPSIAWRQNQTILMIIDAWRSNFANVTNMPYAYEHKCHHIELKTDIPTVTMPRLKSLTTGSVSDFIDVVYNLGHTNNLKDSLLHRLKAHDKKIVFAGDHTWLKLFPSIFLRTYANMDSFYVNDFYEGDKNISRTLYQEIKLHDWNLFIIHYLGLDHIGHVEGSDSSKIFSKLLEMDEVIRFITTNKNFHNQLLIVTSDHGMRNGGGHGGNDDEELYVPLWIFQNDCARKKNEITTVTKYRQIDITVTLCALFNIPIPDTSVGILIADLINNFSSIDQLTYYFRNTQHLFNKMLEKFSMKEITKQNYYKWFIEATAAHQRFLTGDSNSAFTFERAKQNYIRTSKILSDHLSIKSVHFRYDLIVIGLILSTLSALSLLMFIIFDINDLYRFSNNDLLKYVAISSIITIIAYYFNYLELSNIFIILIIIMEISWSLYLLVNLCKLLLLLLLPLNRTYQVEKRLTIPWIIKGFFIFHILSMSSSSFIEEEHQTWYYFTSTLMVILMIQNVHYNIKLNWTNTYNLKRENIILIIKQCWEMRFILIAMLVIIIVRCLNRSGNKWYHLIDLGDILNSSRNIFYLHFCFLSALIILLWLLRKYNTSLQLVLCGLALITIFFYKQNIVQPLLLTLLVFWGCIILIIGLSYWRLICQSSTIDYIYGNNSNLVSLLATNLTCSLLISTLLHKPHNAMLVPGLIFVLEQSYRLCDNLYLRKQRRYNRYHILIYKTTVTIFISHMFYFAQGNTNSLSTIDLNAGYIGLNTYKPIIVGLLITLNLYCAPINSFLYLLWHMFATQITNLSTCQDKEMYTNANLLQNTEDDLYLMINFYTTFIILPVAIYWCLLVGFRYHLFVYTVFAPKALYECSHILVFYFNYIVTHFYFMLFK